MTKLNEIPKKNCFKTPPGYFDQLQEDVRIKVKNRKNKTFANSTYQLVKPYIYLAAGMIVLVALMRLGLEFGVGDYKVSKPEVAITEEASYLDDLFDNLLYDDSFIMAYILDSESESDVYTDDDYFDEEFLEDYLSQYIYDFDDLFYQ